MAAILHEPTARVCPRREILRLIGAGLQTGQKAEHRLLLTLGALNRQKYRESLDKLRRRRMVLQPPCALE
jgi:hypothetical protein